MDEPVLPLLKTKSIEEDLDALFESGIYSDFSLKFGDTVFKLHSFVLSSWDFFHVLKHSNEHKPADSGISVDTFRFVFPNSLSKFNFFRLKKLLQFIF